MAEKGGSGDRFIRRPTPAPSAYPVSAFIIPLRCESVAQFARLYIGNVRAGRLRLSDAFADKRGRVIVRAILGDGVVVDFPGELEHDGQSVAVRFDPVSADLHTEVARMVSGF